MEKIICMLLLSLTLVSCGKKGGSSSESNIFEVGSPWTEEYAPKGLSDKVFKKSSNTYAPMNFLSQELTLNFDVKTQKTTGEAHIKFALKKAGRPYFELKATPKNILVNTVEGSASAVTDPDNQLSFWAFNEELESQVVHEVSFTYELPSDRVSYVSSGARFLTDMTDLSGKFFEYWGPTGFEEDAFKMNLTLNVLNSEAKHQLYTNGEVTQTSNQQWQITFPDFYTKSSFYVHLTNKVLPEQKITIKGMQKEIPVHVYGLTTSLVNSAVAELPKLFAELEKDYGPYPHPNFLVYMNDRSGGMEYAAATITSLASLDHELLHSWFARGVIPADGRSGWIDEAIASWRDYGYQRASSTLGRTATNLANYSPFRKTTPSNAYVDGRGLMAELSLQFEKIGGLKKVLRALSQKYHSKVITNEEFWDFLEEHTGMDLEAFNQRYALGNSSGIKTADLPINNTAAPMPISKHPTPLTEEEILRLR